jgi:carbon-monoxide dehydrogenase medium subunit
VPSWAYHEPTNLVEAVDLLGRYDGEAKLIAGGQSLLIMLQSGLLAPQALVALQSIAELDGIDTADGALLVGANATHQQVHRHPLVRTGWPLLAEVTGAVATIQVRNRGTLCGSVAHALPLSEPPAALLALDAEAQIVGPSGGRPVPLAELFVDFMTTQLGPDEILTALRIPPPLPRTCGAYEVLRGRPLDFPVAGVAARLTLDGDRRCHSARVALVGGGMTPLRSRSAETLLEDEPLGPNLIAEAAAAVSREADPSDDLNGSAAYKRRVLGVLTRRALARAASDIDVAT